MHLKHQGTFPKEFLWGASTSSFQVEGGFDEGGKGLGTQDVVKPNPGRCDFHVASDFYHHYKEDIALMGELGLKAYRMSISWTRVFPNGDDEEVNMEGINFYKNVFRECRIYGIEPIVTIFHYDFPIHLNDAYGGWSNRDMIDIYARYAKTLFTHFKEDVTYWLTYNEQNMVAFFGAFDIIGDTKRVRSEKLNNDEIHNQLVAQAKAIHLCHELCPNAKIGPAPNITSCYPKDSDPINNLAALDFSTLRNWLYLDALCKGYYPRSIVQYWKDRACLPDIMEGDMELMKTCHPDYIAFNYYGGTTVEAFSNVDVDYTDVMDLRTDDITFLIKLMEKPGIGTSTLNPFIKTNEYGMGLDPIGLRLTMRELTDRYHLPLMITENGCGAKDTLTPSGHVHDAYRIEYLARHIEQIKLAIMEGVELIGYCPWSAIDLISSREGCSKRYGFIYVNRDEFDLLDMRRVRKDSFYWYHKVIQSNGEHLEQAVTYQELQDEHSDKQEIERHTYEKYSTNGK